MNLRSHSVTRSLGIAFATALLAGSLAGATSAATPAGDVLDADFRFRDELGQTAVLAVYPYSDTQSRLTSFRIRGPKVSWIQSHEDDWGFVGWRVIIETAPTKNGPWSLDRRTKYTSIMADTTGPLERFPTRFVNFEDRTGTFYVRIKSRIFWFREDGHGEIAWAKHQYTKYGLVVSSGVEPDFGDEEYTRAVAPNKYPS